MAIVNKMRIHGDKTEDVTIVKTADTLDESFCTSVKFGDDSTVSVKGKGTVAIVPKGTSVQMIKEVFYVPELKTNLLSVGQFAREGI